MAIRLIREAKAGASSWLLGVAVATAVIYGCSLERTYPAGDTMHPKGYANPSSPDFHGTDLATHGFPLADCRKCHGDNYDGGSTGKSCQDAGCHSKGVESCTTCHGQPPSTGAHAGHDLACTACHPSRVDARHPGHPDGVVDLSFSALASSNGYAPAFDRSSGSCTDVYCHLGRVMKWQNSGPLTCSGCHDDPPASHARFATSASDCTSCHGSMTGHIDGKVEVAPLACDGCHGKGPLGAPPPGFGGVMSSPAIGVHASHLDPGIPDRIGRVARCDDCHDVPTTVDAAGHLSGSPHAAVTLKPSESYDPSTHSCVVGCHWNRDPGPRWDDTSGAALKCDACHGFPPVKTRTGATHPPASPDLAVCVTCHVFDPSTHVDGKVDFQ